MRTMSTRNLIRRWVVIGILHIVTTGQIENVSAQTGAQAKGLRTKLFVTDGYDYRIRPTNTQGSYVHVTVDFNLWAINDLDEVTETLKTTGFLEINWQDDFLVWNASDWGNISIYHWPQEDIWKPDIALSNSYLEYKQLGVDSLNVAVTNNGTVTWNPFQVFVSTCSIDITYFPFDEQVCNLKFTTQSYTKPQLLVSGGSSGIVLKNYQTNSQWDIVQTWWAEHEDKTESSIIFYLKIRRKPLFEILTMILPVILLASLNILAFLLPCESGEKAGYSITVFLAFAIFLTIMESSFPENSETVAFFAVYVIIQTTQSTMIAFLSLMMIKCSQFDDSVAIPRPIITMANIGNFKFGMLNCVRRKKNKVRQMKKNDLAQTKKAVELVDVSDEERNNIGWNDKTVDVYTWNTAMNGLDNFLLIFFTCILLAMTFWCLLAAYVGK